MTTTMTAVTGAAAVGSCLVGGVFFAFSGFVLPALGRLPAPVGAAAMQSVNRLAVTPPLMVALFGTAAACVVVGVVAARAVVAGGEGVRLAAALALGGAVVYLAAGVLVTVVANVPLNDRLAAVDPSAAATASVWDAYRSTWAAWNHVRTVGCLAAGSLLIAALRAAGRA